VSFLSVQLALKTEGGPGELEKDPPDDRLQGCAQFRHQPQQPVAAGEEHDELIGATRRDVRPNGVGDGARPEINFLMFSTFSSGFSVVFRSCRRFEKRTRRDRLIHPLTSALSKDTTFYNDVYVATLANELAGASGSNQRGKKTRLLLLVFATKKYIYL